MRHTSPMPSISLYHRHRFPAEIFSHCVWLYFRFALSFRDVEEMLAMRGVSLSYETVREWCLNFGQTYANGLRHKSPPSPWRPMASRRSVSKDQRTSPLPLACSRSGWRRVGYSGPEPEGQEGSKEVLSQATKGVEVCPAGDHYSHAEELDLSGGKTNAAR